MIKRALKRFIIISHIFMTTITIIMLILCFAMLFDMNNRMDRMSESIGFNIELEIGYEI
jgi:hypothetical protein